MEKLNNKSSKGILLYGNGGSGNHGCEAIIRGTVSLLEERPVIHSISVNEDIQYNIDEIAEIVPAIEKKRMGIRFLSAYIKLKLTGKFTDMDGLSYLPAIRRAREKCNIAFSVGGDNYCYDDTDIYGYLNKAYNKIGIKTVLWGCSIEPEVVGKAKIAKDLSRYRMIVARESITYEAVKAVNPNTFLSPDPAFFMKAQKCNVDDRFKYGNVVGINISPMIVSNESSSGITMKNYQNLIQYILDNTEYYIALIPHVVWSSNDDRSVLEKLYQIFKDNKRLIMVEDHKASELKYIISQCQLFIGARTHATIAAYSSGIPTLVIGYSVKAKGIAKDLFGTDEKYVIPVQKLDGSMELVNAFKWLDSNQKKIYNHLKLILPKYIQQGIEIKEKILSLI